MLLFDGYAPSFKVVKDLLQLRGGAVIDLVYISPAIGEIEYHAIQVLEIPLADERLDVVG